MRRIGFMLLLPAMIAGVLSCASVEPGVSVPVVQNVSTRIRPVRVLVGVCTRTQSLELSAGDEVEVWSPDGAAIIGRVRLQKTPVGFSRGEVVIGTRSWGWPAVILNPSSQSNDHIRVRTTEYPGQMVLMTRGESVAAINYVGMEEYVAGVVSCEMPSYFEPAALQAQAVAARTYVLWEMKQSALEPYDVKDDVSNQVYRGLTGMTRAGRQAAERTSGAVLVYDWQFLPAFYHSTCGGHTVPASQLRGAPIMAPLRGVECGYCRSSKRYAWAISIPSEEIEKGLAQAGLLSGNLVDIAVTRTVPGGWVDTVDIVSAGARRPVAGYVLRQIAGTSRLYSTNFAVTKSGEKYVFEGRGFGHGVGLCQWGANGMALKGFTFADVLRHYYPGAGILKIY